MKYSWKGHKDRNRHKNRRTREWKVHSWVIGSWWRTASHRQLVWRQSGPERRGPLGEGGRQSLQGPFYIATRGIKWTPTVEMCVTFPPSASVWKAWEQSEPQAYGISHTVFHIPHPLLLKGMGTVWTTGTGNIASATQNRETQKEIAQLFEIYATPTPTPHLSLRPNNTPKQYTVQKDKLITVPHPSSVIRHV